MIGGAEALRPFPAPGTACPPVSGVSAPFAARNPFDISGGKRSFRQATEFCARKRAKIASECRKSGRAPLFRAFTGFASRIRSRAAKPAKHENLWVFIRSDAHVVRAGLHIRGCGPLSTPGFFDRLKRPKAAFFDAPARGNLPRDCLHWNQFVLYYHGIIM